MEAPPFHGWDYSLDFHRVFPRVAAGHDVVLVPFLLADVLFEPQLLLGDGLHPSAAGARRIAETVWPYLESVVASIRAAEK
jgi:acyl-CoA thioesterase-1